MGYFILSHPVELKYILTKRLNDKVIYVFIFRRKWRHHL